MARKSDLRFKRAEQLSLIDLEAPESHIQSAMCHMPEEEWRRQRSQAIATSLALAPIVSSRAPGGTMSDEASDCFGERAIAHNARSAAAVVGSFDLS